MLKRTNLPESPQPAMDYKGLSFILQLTNPADLEVLASATQILTSKPEELTPENVTTAAQIANQLLRSPNATEVRTGDPSQSKSKSVDPTVKKLNPQLFCRTSGWQQ